MKFSFPAFSKEEGDLQASNILKEELCLKCGFPSLTLPLLLRDSGNLCSHPCLLRTLELPSKQMEIETCFSKSDFSMKYEGVAK